MLISLYVDHFVHIDHLLYVDLFVLTAIFMLITVTYIHHFTHPLMISKTCSNQALLLSTYIGQS